MITGLKKHGLFFATLCALAGGLVFLSACGPRDNGNDDTADGEVTITGNDMMQFSPTSFTVNAGSEVTIRFRNIGQMPKEAMGHNLAVLTMGTDPNAFASASQRHPDNRYIAPDLEDQVIAATDVLGPGEEETITFAAPDEPGEYPFVCSFPGHTQAGMRGVMTVR